MAPYCSKPNNNTATQSTQHLIIRRIYAISLRFLTTHYRPKHTLCDASADGKEIAYRICGATWQRCPVKLRRLRLFEGSYRLDIAENATSRTDIGKRFKPPRDRLCYRDLSTYLPKSGNRDVCSLRCRLDVLKTKEMDPSMWSRVHLPTIIRHEARMRVYSLTGLEWVDSLRAIPYT